MQDVDFKPVPKGVLATEREQRDGVAMKKQEAGDGILCAGPTGIVALSAQKLLWFPPQ